VASRLRAAAALLAAASLGSLGAGAAADETVGCGLGTRIWQGEESVVFQLLAFTTNATSSTQPLGISSETCGCTRGGVIMTGQRLSMFAGANLDRLARDMAHGEGEALETLAGLLGIPQAERGAFRRLTRENFAALFPSEEATAGDMLATLRRLLAARGMGA